MLNIDGNFDLNENFTVMYKAKQGSLVAVRVFAYYQIRTIKPFQVVEDYVLPYSQQTFKLSLDSDLYKFNFS